MKKFAEDIKELMEKWNKTRGAWIKEFGSDEGFQDWFSEQTKSTYKDLLGINK